MSCKSCLSFFLGEPTSGLLAAPAFYKLLQKFCAHFEVRLLITLPGVCVIGNECAQNTNTSENY